MALLSRCCDHIQGDVAEHALLLQQLLPRPQKSGSCWPRQAQEAMPAVAAAAASLPAINAA
jgi:hypothetical protein